MSRLPIRTIQPAGQPDAIGALGQGLMSVAGAVHQRDMALQRAEEQVAEAERARKALVFDEETAVQGATLRGEISRMNDADEIASSVQRFQEQQQERLRSIPDAQLRDAVSRQIGRERTETRVTGVQRRAEVTNIRALADLESLGERLSLEIEQGNLLPEEAIETYQSQTDSLVFGGGAINELQAAEMLSAQRFNFVQRHVTGLLNGGMADEASAMLSHPTLRSVLTNQQLRSIENQVREAEGERIRANQRAAFKDIFNRQTEGLAERVDAMVQSGDLQPEQGMQIMSMIGDLDRQQVAAQNSIASDAFYKMLYLQDWQSALAATEYFTDPKARFDRRQELSRVFDNYSTGVIEGNLRDLDASLAGVTTGLQEDITAAEAGFETYIARSRSLLDEAPSTFRSGLEREIAQSLGTSLDSAMQAAAAAGQVETVSALGQIAQSDMLRSPDRSKLALNAMNTAANQEAALERTQTAALGIYNAFRESNRLDPNRPYTQEMTNAIYARAIMDGTQKDVLRAMRDLHGAPIPTAARTEINNAFVNNDALTIGEYVDILGAARVRTAGGSRGQNVISDGVLRLFTVGDRAAAREIASRITSVGSISIEQQNAIKSQWHGMDDSEKMAAIGIPSGTSVTVIQGIAMREAYAIGTAMDIEPSEVFGAMYESVEGRLGVISGALRMIPTVQLLGRLRGAVGSDPAFGPLDRPKTFVPRNLQATPQAIASIEAAARLNSDAAFGDAVALPDGGVAAPIYGERGGAVGFTIIGNDGTIEYARTSAADGDPRFAQAHAALLGRNDPELSIRSSSYASNNAIDNNAVGKSFIEVHRNQPQKIVELRDEAVRMLQARGFAVPEGRPLTDQERAAILDAMNDIARQQQYKGFQ